MGLKLLEGVEDGKPKQYVCPRGVTQKELSIVAVCSGLNVAMTDPEAVGPTVAELEFDIE